MITRITKENAKQYTELFKKASDVLDSMSTEPGTSVPVTNLEEYFGVIEVLAAREISDPNGVDEAAEFLRLPQDEGVFEIDANARTISIPAEFKKNGVGVVGDKLAEILYFKVNRYFDDVDLNNTDIFFIWENAEKEKKQGVTRAIYRFIEKEAVEGTDMENEYLVFGWPLCEEITAASGNVKAMVSFITESAVEDGESFSNDLVYALNTQAIQLAVKAGLKFDIEALSHAEDLKPQVKQRLLNSFVAARPQLEQDGDLVPTANLAGSQFDEAIELSFKALPVGKKEDNPKIAEDATVSYRWYKDGELITNEISDTLSVDSVGQYQAVAINEVMVNIGRPNAAGEYTHGTQKMTSKIASTVCEIPLPVATEIVEEVANTPLYSDDENAKMLVCKVSSPEGYHNYSVEYAANLLDPEFSPVDSLEVVEGVEGALSADLSNLESGLYRFNLVNHLNKENAEAAISAPARLSKSIAITSHDYVYIAASENATETTIPEKGVPAGRALRIKLAFNETPDKISYQWMKHTEDPTDNEDIAGATDMDFLPTNGGKYHCRVVAELNGKTTEYISEEETVLVND